MKRDLTEIKKLAAEMQRPLPGTATIQRLKRRKLLVKDELAGIERLLEALGTKTAAPHSPLRGAVAAAGR